MSDRWARQNAEQAAVLAERRNVNKNVSLQTGEEFSMEFLKDHHHTPVQSPIVSGKTHNDGNRFGGDLYYHQNHLPGYDSAAARFHELRRIESECPSSDAYDFGRDPRSSSIRVENGYVPHFSAYHNVGGENEVITRKAFGEINSNRGDVTGRSAPCAFLPERVQSNNYTGGGGGVGDFDRFGKVKFLCSFGGRIMPRSTDEKLKYVGGETHIISIRKNLSWEELKKKTSAICQQPHSIKYQLPGDELDSLISVSSDEDLQNMIEEYNGLERLEGSQRPRLFLIPIGEPERKVQQTTPDSQYAAAINSNAVVGQTLVGDTRYHVNNLDRIPSFRKQAPGQMLRLDTATMHPNPLFNGVQYNMPTYPSPPVSPSPFQQRDSNGVYSQFPGNNSSSESNNSFSPAQPDTPSFEAIDSKYHQQRPLPSVNCQPNKHEAENLYGMQFQNGFNEKLVTPSSSHVDTLCFNPERSANNGRVYSDKASMPEESKVSFSGSTNSNDSCLGIPHSYSDSTLEINGGHSSYFSQERQSPSSTLNFTKKQTEEKSVQVHRNNDLADRRTQSDILDMKSTEGGETMFKFSPRPGGPGLSGENKTLHIDISAAGNHYDEIYLNQETKNQGGYNDTIFHLGGKVLGTKATPTDMDGKTLPTYGYQTSAVVDPWKQIKQDNERLIAGTSSANLISLEEGIAANVPNEEPESRAARERNLEVSGMFLNKRAGSDDNFLFSIASESENRKIGDDTGILEFDLTQNNRTGGEGVLGHVRIPSMDLNQPAPATVSDTYDLKILSVEREDSPQSIPHAKMNSDDTVFLSEEAEANTGEKENSFKDTLFVEMEASVYGLQIIKNADLEDLTELGSGTYGTVYHGTWRGTDVAIKRIRKSCFAGRSSEQERLTKDFWREAQILSNLHHPNVVAFYGIVPDGTGGTLATVTEFMVNGSLRHALIKKDRLLDFRKKIIIAMDAAFGMEYLHSKNIVHFDLKCENLLVNLRDPQRPICKVGDLGLSRIKRNTLVSGGVRGTLPWMAPELLNGSSTRVSEKVDVFSYGISLWEILTGEEPYADMHYGAIIGGIVKNTLRPPIPKTCSADWKNLMEQCWSVDPDSRPPFTEITSRLRTMSMDLVTKSKRRENKP
ncbi:PREDICTED: probable serine/threonine-protein kinase DDB_G0267686 [Camelina sativa]|uniref:Probable serine/threonine-protein kinase DDB_G0267686 n=1 Tax=Camelina sativa TaxID=90675 RepID=A0ABM0W7Q7_CAMSA|nr:PREDICTED: probable serine/threonine-protein kinase DDB_G0267686 [Camelina sativa]XP_010466899.1 PREDICTED: probable serine/threonine-protein kinase DDB_G0267686 [Camelina sativa]XP_010466900.1 PREDICTED: probable serine/threonine-protein kinase DDB_G0267686 [Camelina sativa]